jgi:excisionase family DNA binding protein
MTSRSEFLTTADVADVCSVSVRTVCRWISEGRLPALQLGAHSYRIREADLNTFLTAAEIDRNPQTAWAKKETP